MHKISISIFNNICNYLNIKNIVILSNTSQILNKYCHKIKIQDIIQCKNFKHLVNILKSWKNIYCNITLNFLPNNKYKYCFDHIHTLNLISKYPLLFGQNSDININLINIIKKKLHFIKNVNTLIITDVFITDDNKNLLPIVYSIPVVTVYPEWIYNRREYVGKTYHYGKLVYYDRYKNYTNRYYIHFQYLKENTTLDKIYINLLNDK
jgi:hypothetical protein